MNFFRVAIYLGLVMIVFNLVLGYIGSLETAEGNSIFPVNQVPGMSEVNETSALSKLTLLEGDMENGLWLLATVGVNAGMLVYALITQSWIPLGVSLFSTVFWTAWLRTNSILSFESLHLPSEFLGIFFIVMMLIYFAAVIGMFTGSD